MKSGTVSTDKERRQKKINSFDNTNVAEKRVGKSWLILGIIYVVHI
jgi:hypothetical protein